MSVKTNQPFAPACPCDLSKFCAERKDEEIIEYVKENKECYAQLVERYEEKLTRYIKRISGVSIESVEDILQTVFLKAYVNLNSFDSKMRFSPWIYRIAHNETVNYWRKHSKKDIDVISLNENDFLENIIPAPQDVNRDALQSLDGGIILASLEKLKGNYKKVLKHRYLDELSYSEIAEKLDKPIGTVGTLANRGKRLLRDELIKVGFTSAAL
ncbi:MAG: RNA polymerase sigma factor [Parcubacteria group bacterium]|jgi:RNA polymerase sigma-70 factor (ECF subfamily)